MRLLLAFALAASAASILVAPGPARAATDQQVHRWAKEAAAECRGLLERALADGRLTEADLFDRLYVPIPNTDPPKFNTRYDAFFDRHIQVVQDRYLDRDKGLVFVIMVDRNGYLAAHNSRYCKPLTGDKAKDAVGNRTKRIFNDRTGITAARNQKPFLLQEYLRDNGEIMKDLSVPVVIRGRHWGALRVGYR